MKLLSVTLLALLLTPSFAEAKKGFSNQEIRALTTKLKQRSARTHKRLKAFADPLVRFSIAPGAQPKQGELVTIFLTPNTGFTDSEILIEAKLDNADAALEHPSEDLWILSPGAFTELKAHTVTANIFLQDKAQATQIRDAVRSLETQIADLNEQIANASDPDLIAQLTAQRDEKAALKNDLVTALANLKTQFGSENYSFEVVAQDTGTEFPRILSVSPNLVKASGGTTITISGANFDTNPQVKIGGVSTPITSSDSASIVMDTPWLPTGQTHDIEVRFDINGVVKNAIRKNAVYATDDVVPVVPPLAPVGIAEAVNSPVVVGGSAQVTAMHSYDPNGSLMNFEWRLISKPSFSQLPLSGQNPVSTAQDYIFTPDAPGNYVLELRVAKAVEPFLIGNVSLAVVEATAPANRAPTGSAPAISVSKNFSKTTQFTASDADFWQARSFFVTKQSAFGSATVSSSGLVTYQAGANPGADTVDVTVVDNGTPPLSSVISIPVTVLNNAAPVIQSIPFGFQRTDGVPFQVRFGLFGISSGAVTDPDGTIQSLVWDFGDGTHERIFDYGAASATHNYMAPGNYTATLTATDNSGAVTSVSGPVVVRAGAVPNAKFKYDVRAGSVPLTINLDASASSGPSGIAVYRWLFNDSPTEVVTTTPYITHTWNTAVPSGQAYVRLRTRETNSTSGGEGESAMLVFTGQPDPGPVGHNIPVVGPPRMVTLGTPTLFDGSNSFCSAAGHDITSYNWTFGYFSASGNGVNQSFTYPNAQNYFPGLQAFADTGGTSPRVYIETWAVNTGAPPRTIARFDRTSGPAPLTIHVDGSESYDYDGTLGPNSFHWIFESGSAADSPTATHTFNTPGAYNVSFFVNDADGNVTQMSTTVTVTSSAAEAVHANPIKKLDYMEPAEREYQRQVLAGACWQGNEGEACYQLGQMYSEDGDEFTKTKLWEKACGLGYQQACGR